MIGDVGPMELLIILAVVVLLFGAGKVSKLGKELGASVREFRRAIQDVEGVVPIVFVEQSGAATVVAEPSAREEQDPSATSIRSTNIF